MRRLRPLLQYGLLVAAAAVTAASARAQALGQALQSPAAQKGVPSTTSAIQTSMTWPTGSSGNYLDFDWRIDSEPNYDFLKVFVDGSLAYQWSGLGLAGHVSRSMSPGTHLIRFEYSKDSSVNRGRDTAWVDNLLAASNGKILALHHFDARVPRMAAFTASGTGGGFSVKANPQSVALERPIGQAFAGINTGSTSRVERQITWPGGSSPTLSFSYLVDSELNYDFLRVYVDSVKVWEKSGLDIGNATVTLASAGTHTIAFEYAKDTSVDVGRDTAQVYGVAAATADVRFLSEPLDGLGLGTVPDGWTPSGSSGGWRTTDPSPALAYMTKGSGAPEPTLDGVIRHSPTSVEYTAGTMFAVADVGSASGPAGTVYLRESDGSQSLFVGVRVKSSTVTVGSEDGDIVLLFDANRPDTLLGLGCSAPGAEDRRITIHYSAGVGVQPTVTSATQEKGTCQGPWVAVAAGEDWPTTIGISEAVADPGFIHLEMKIVLRPSSASTSQVLTDGRLGFALVHRNLSGLVSTENLPGVRGLVIPQDRPKTWLTLDMTSGDPSLAYGVVLGRPLPDEALRRFVGAP